MTSSTSVTTFIVENTLTGAQTSTQSAQVVIDALSNNKAGKIAIQSQGATRVFKIKSGADTWSEEAEKKLSSFGKNLSNPLHSKESSEFVIVEVGHGSGSGQWTDAEWMQKGQHYKAFLSTSCQSFVESYAKEGFSSERRIDDLKKEIKNIMTVKAAYTKTEFIKLLHSQ